MAKDEAIWLNGATVTSTTVPDRDVAEYHNCQRELFSAVVHQFEIEVMFIGNELVFSITKLILAGLARELPPLYGGFGKVVIVVCALMAAKEKSNKEKSSTIFLLRTPG